MHLDRLKKAEKCLCQLCIFFKASDRVKVSAHSCYSFYRTSREISDLEGELVSLKNPLSSRANIIHGIADGVRIESLPDGTDHAREAADLEFQHTASKI